eukprot:751369-Hanusia_phi.AAC.3
MRFGYYNRVGGGVATVTIERRGATSWQRVGRGRKEEREERGKNGGRKEQGGEWRQENSCSGGCQGRIARKLKMRRKIYQKRCLFIKRSSSRLSSLRGRILFLRHMMNSLPDNICYRIHQIAFRSG